MTARRIGAAVAMLLVIALAACTDDDGLTGNQKHDISSFRAGANSICTSATAAGHAAVAQAKAQFPSAPTVDQAHSFLVTTVIPIADREVGDLHNLGEPTLDRASWDDIRAQLDTNLSDLKAAADADPVGTLTRIMNTPTGAGAAALDRSMVAFGIAECAKS